MIIKYNNCYVTIYLLLNESVQNTDYFVTDKKSIVGWVGSEPTQRKCDVDLTLRLGC